MGGIFFKKGNVLKKNIDLYVIRIKNQIDLGNARPCYNCVQLLKAVGIRRVYYSTGEDYNFEYEKVSHMISIQASSTRQYIDSGKAIQLIKVNKDEYYWNLLLKNFPKKICEIHFDKFVKYNLLDVLPKCIIIKIKKSIIIKLVDREIQSFLL